MFSKFSCSIYTFAERFISHLKRLNAALEQELINQGVSDAFIIYQFISKRQMPSVLTLK